MDDAEVTRNAIGISFLAWSRLQARACEKSSEDDLLKEYIGQCPFVSSSSPAIAAATRGLDQWKQQHRHVSKQHFSYEPDKFVAPTDATRVAMRIAVSTWAQLHVQSETSDDWTILKKYILLCPYVSPQSDVALAALQCLEQSENTHQSPLLVDVESDSEESDGDHHPGEEKALKQQQQQPTTTKTDETPTKTSTKTARPLLILLRSILLDGPMALLFASYFSLLWVRRVHDLYLKPQLDAAVFSDSRAAQETTYYNRECDLRDLTTNNAQDLILSTRATANEAYEHQLYHGFTIFQSVLSDDTVRDLRAFVDSKNRKLSKEESIFVIENKNRYSFGLGTEEPSVTRAMMEIGNHPQLVPALEKVLGPNPALIEMTAITSSYGAIDQYWHDDIIASVSTLKYGRTFMPAYSLFVQLQNTTARMGATGACPGSHYCGADGVDEICEEGGFQVVGEEGYWTAGDALLMNMNSYHRGAAHTDPDALDRVMLILTFVPKPQKRAESRQMSQGITFSLRWDMWGHTLADLALADTRMTQPWATLRALGLYKQREAEWGIDYVHSALMRMANEDNGFRPDELDTWIERGGFYYLPSWLEGQVGETGTWHDYLLDTLDRCVEFAFFVRAVALIVYLLTSLLIGVVAPKRFGFRGVGSAIIRVGLIYGALYLLSMAADHHVDNSNWAKDINAGRRWTDPYQTEIKNRPSTKHFPSTLPHRKDVLIETRYGSRYLNMYNDFVDGHPGSRFFRKLVREGSKTFKAYPEFFRNATAHFIVSTVESEQGRFLHQDVTGIWVWLDREDALDYTRAELAVESNKILATVRQELRFLTSDYTYGFLRTAVLAKHSINYLHALQDRLLRNTTAGKATFTSVSDALSSSSIGGGANISGTSLTSMQSPFARKSMLAIPRPLPSMGNVHKRSRITGIGKPPKEPRYGAWLKSGDDVEGTEFIEDTGEAHWYKGRLRKVSPNGDYYVNYDDESFGLVNSKLVRSYQPYYVGEEVEVFLSDEDGDVVDPCTIVSHNDDASYNVFIDEKQQLVEGIFTGELRRPRHDNPIQDEVVIRNHYA